MSARAIGLSVGAVLVFGVLATSPVAPPLDAAASPCEIEGVDRIVAIGDVHGAYDRFVEILRTAGLIDARLRWTGGKAHLVQLGDVLDRGPDSLKVLDLLRRLERDAPRAGGAVHALLGNHETMRMIGDLRYTVPAEYQAFVTQQSWEARQSYVLSQPPAVRNRLLDETPLGWFEMRVAFGRQGDYGQWFRKLNVLVRINGILFVHGGISPAAADRSCQAINQAARRELTEDEDKTRADLLKSLVGSADGPVWYRGLAEEPDSFAPQVDEILAKQSARAIVIAHTVTADGRIRARFGGKVLQIDTGMQPAYVQGGRAAALEIQNEVFTAIYVDRRNILETPTAASRSVPVARSPSSVGARE